MANIINYIKKHSWTDIALIALLMIICACAFAKHISIPMVDIGRELFLPEQIINGYVPYKDITMIYFPTAYYINAFIYKIFGISLNSLVLAQTLLCTLFMFVYYYLAREFVNRSISVVLSVLVVFSCIYSVNDMFNFITPYSYAMVYGVMSFIVCLFLIIKLFKTDQMKYAYMASICAGFSFICKMEFFSCALLLIVAMIIYKKIKYIEYVKIFLCFFIFPILLLGFLILQGVTISDIINAFDFANKFSKTPVMIEFLSGVGMYPINMEEKIKHIVINSSKVAGISILCFIGLYLYNKFHKIAVLLLFFVFIVYSFFEKNSILHFWSGLPIIIFIILCFNFKTIKENRSMLILIVGGLLLSIRVFFCLSMLSYGTYSMPLLFLIICVIVCNYCPKYVMNIESEKVLAFVLTVIMGLNLAGLNMLRQETKYPLQTDKGTLYIDYETITLFAPVINYIKSNINKNSTVLVLPEGNIINYLTDRKADLHCFMMDRLYHDAYGEEESMNKIAQSESDYILLTNYLKINNFKRPYLYEPYTSLSSKYIFENYKLQKSFLSKQVGMDGVNFAYIKIYKKINNEK